MSSILFSHGVPWCQLAEYLCPCSQIHQGKYTQKPRAMQMRKHFDWFIPRQTEDFMSYGCCSFRDRQKTSCLMDVAGWARHTSRQACIAEAQQYMWTFMAKYTQTPKAMQTCLQLPRRNSINLNIPAATSHTPMSQPGPAPLPIFLLYSPKWNKAPAGR